MNCHSSDKTPTFPPPAQVSEPSCKARAELATELLLLPDGQVMAHNLTPVMADLLLELDSNDREMSARADGRDTQ